MCIFAATCASCSDARWDGAWLDALPLHVVAATLRRLWDNSTRARCRRCEASAVVGGGLEAACRPPPQAAAHDRVAHSNIGDQAHAVRLAFFSISFQVGLRVAALPEPTLTVSPCLAGCLRMPVVMSSRQHRSLLPPSAQAPRARTLRAQHVTAHRLRPCGMRRSTCIELRLDIELTLTWRRSNLGKSTESGGLSRRSALSGGLGRGSSRAPHVG